MPSPRQDDDVIDQLENNKIMNQTQMARNQSMMTVTNKSKISTTKLIQIGSQLKQTQSSTEGNQ